MKSLYEKLYGKPMPDEIRRLGEERAKMTPKEYREYLERNWGRPILGDIEDERREDDI